MKFKLLSAVSVAVLLANSAGLVLADKRPSKARSSVLLSQLPESDAVALIDSRRFFDQALPQVLAAKQPILAEITAKLNQMEQRTGIDLRKFDQLAVGLKMTPRTDRSYDCDPVLIARGTYNAGGLLAAVKVASGGTYREETIGGRTVYIFTAKAIADKHAAKTSNSVAGKVLGHTTGILSGEIAMGSLDASTLVVGSVARVRQTFEGKTSVAADITSLLTPRAGSVASFAARTPDGLESFLPLDNDEIGKNLAAIRYLAGSMNVTAANTTLSLMARTANAEQALGLFDTIDGLRVFGKAILSGSKRPDNQLYVRLIDNAKVGRSGSEVTLDLSVPQSDIDALLALIKKS